MNARRAIAGLALFAVMVLAPATTRAQEDGAHGMFSRLHYSAEGGIMSGVGPQGRPLGRGTSFAFNVHGESTIGMELGLEATYAASNDILNTKFASLGGIARLSPTPEDYRAYVQLGASLYRVTFSPDVQGLVVPKNTIRPGGSFGVGFEITDRTNYSLGGLITYTGVVLAQSAARSYLVAGLTLTFKPSPY